jgi:hypothetical protein
MNKSTIACCTCDRYGTVSADKENLQVRSKHAGLRCLWYDSMGGSARCHACWGRMSDERAQRAKNLNKKFISPSPTAGQTDWISTSLLASDQLRMPADW